MWKRILTPILLIINLVAAAQEKVMYDPNVEKRSVGSFHSIAVSDGIDLYLVQTGEEEVAVSASQIGIRDRIKTVVENGELKIYLPQEWNWRNKRLTAYVSVKTINRIKASGGADVVLKNEISGEKLEMKLSGGSDFNGKVAISNLTIEQSGGSDVNISGKVENLKVTASGGSDFKGYDLIAEYAILQTSGGSDASITVNKEMAAEASGGSDVNYKGNPVIKYKSASGGGSVSKRG